MSVRRRASAGLIAAAAAVAACASPTVPAPRPARIEGRIEGVVGSLPADTAVEVYRVDERGFAAPVAGERPVPDGLGRFTTSFLGAGRYVLVLRSTDLPISTATTSVPPGSPVVLRTYTSADHVEIRLRAPADAGGPLRCRLTQARTSAMVADRRELTLAPGAVVAVRGLAPGIWRLDLPDRGATTDVALWKRDDVREVVVDPPPALGASEVFGRVSRLDGEGAPGLAVTVRPLDVEGPIAQPWGRFAISDADGRYRVTAVPEGAAYLRVETRDLLYHILPPPEVVPIPPSGQVERGFLVEP